MQINRLLEIVYVLLRQKNVTARELSERFGVSCRTIYRDIDILSLSGIPVFTEKGKGGGISLLPDFVLSKSILNEREQNEILSALQSLGSVKASETDQILQKLSAVFNKNTINWLEVDFSDWSYANGGKFQDFKTAILERRVAEFDYYSTYGEKTHRRVEPLQLWFKSKTWYVKGFCLNRQSVRLFKLTRVKNMSLTDERFSERDLLAPSPETERPHKPDMTFKLKISPEMAYRVYDEFDESQITTDNNGYFIVGATWPVDDWVYGILLSYGEYIEILEPECARDVLREKIRKISELYL